MPVRIVVDNRVRVSLSEMGDFAAAAVREKFVHANPLYGKPRHKDEPPSLRTWEHDGDWLTVPRGGMARVRDALRSLGLSWSVEDARTWEYPEPDFPDHLKTLRPDQEKLVAAAVSKQNCALRAPTGAGKTVALFGLLARLKRRALVMVWTEALLRQWRERAEEELGLSPDEIGIVGEGKVDVRPLTLGMQQSVVAQFRKGNVPLADAFDVVACDELQRFAAPTLFASVDPFRARYRIGVSADETRKDEKEFLIYDLFGDVAAKTEEEELLGIGAVVDVEVYVVPTNFRAPWYRYRQDFKKLLDQLVADEERNALLLRCARKVAAQGEQVLVFTHRVEHAREVDARLCAAGVPSGVLLGGASERTTFSRSVEGLRSGHLRAGAGTYQAIGQGIDLPTVSRGIAATPVANNRQLLGQVKGRLCRSADGKERGRLFYLLDRYVYGRKPIVNFVKWFRTVRVWDEKERAWVEGKQWLVKYGGRLFENAG